MTKDGIVGKTSGGRQAKEKVSTTDDSFHTCTWTTLLDRTEKKSITSPVPSALGIVHYIDEIVDPIDLKAWSMTADGITLLLARVKQLHWQRKIIVGRARD